MKSRHQHHSHKLFAINANWTALQPVQGWRHYRIATVRRDSVGQKELEMMAVCDRTVRFWLPKAALKSSNHWQPGWQ